VHGVLAGLRDIGAVLAEVRAVPPAPEPALAAPLRTERLTIRAATLADLEPTWAFRRLDAVNEWITGGPDDLDGYRQLFTEPQRFADTAVVTLGHEDDGPVIGDFMVRREDAWAQRGVTEQARGRQVELGWVLDPAHHGNGYATEAVRELLRHCFEDLGIRRVTAVCFLDNDTSWRLMERVGMRRELHAVKDALHRSGRWLDTLGYAILAEEWSPGS